MTPFAKKRRLLREHRSHMRLMEDLIEQNDRLDDYRVDLLVELDTVPFYLGYDYGPDGMDEGSECEDPHADLQRENEDLRREATDQQAFISAVQDLQTYERVRLDLERARMQLEDR